MIKLIVVFLLASVSSDGGVSVTVYESKFTDQQSCLQAKAWFEQQANQLDHVRLDHRARPTKALVINATCIEQKTRP